MSEFRKSSLLLWGLPSFYGQGLGQACRHGGWHFFRKPLLMMTSGFWPLFSIGSLFGLDCPWGLCPGKPRCLLGQPAGGPVWVRPWGGLYQAADPTSRMSTRLQGGQGCQSLLPPHPQWLPAFPISQSSFILSNPLSTMERAVLPSETKKVPFPGQRQIFFLTTSAHIHGSSSGRQKLLRKLILAI